MHFILFIIVVVYVICLVLYAVGIVLAVFWDFLKFTKFLILGFGVLLLSFNVFVFRKEDLVEYEEDCAAALDGSIKDRFLELMEEYHVANAPFSLSDSKPIALPAPDRETPDVD